MRRILIALMAIVALNSAAKSDTPSPSADAIHAALFKPTRTNNQFIRPLAAGRARRRSPDACRPRLL
jgi:hypothetical protein